MSKCKVCRSEFVKRSMTHKCCSPECAETFAKLERAKKERKEIAAKRETFKTRSQWMKEAQIAFNAYIRERDKNRLCICCNRPISEGGGTTGGLFDCGHYRSVGSAPHLRFDERNAHGQRKQCNRWGAGRAVDYRIGLIKRIGLEQVEALEAEQTAKKYTSEELKEIKRIYTAKRKELINASN